MECHIGGHRHTAACCWLAADAVYGKHTHCSLALGLLCPLAGPSQVELNDLLQTLQPSMV